MSKSTLVRWHSRATLLLATLFVVGQFSFAGPGTDDQLWPKGLSQLKVMTYNLRNFNYLYRIPKKELGNLDPKVYPTKPEREIKWEGAILREEMPDILVLQEVMDKPGAPESGKDFLETFNQEELNSAYQIFLIGGNDARGINVAIMIKKGLPFADYRYISNKDMKWKDSANGQKVIPMFSRDLPILEMRLRKADSTPALIVLGSHYKSQRDRKNDPNSKIYRHAQYDATKTIVNGLKGKYGDNVNLLLMADFNEELTGHAEAAIEEVAEDVFDVAATTVPVNERITEVSIAPGGIPHQSMLDDIKISGKISKNVISASIIRYKGKGGQVLPLPQRWNEINQLPSDHFPVEAIIDFSNAIQK